MKYPSFYLSILSFIAGVSFCSLQDFGFYFGIFWIFLALVIWLFRFQFSDNKFILIIPFICMFFGLGLLRCTLSNEVQGKYLLESFVGVERFVLGVVVDEPDERENNTKLTIALTAVTSESRTIKSFREEVKMLVTVPFYPQFEYGDEVNFLGILQKPENFSVDGGREFDYINYLAKDRIFYQMFYPQTKLLSKENGSFLKEKLFKLKKGFLKQISLTVPEPEVSLLGGLLVGAKQSLGQKLQDDFRKVGLIHIVVLSGYNVTIIAEFLMGMLSFLPRLIGLSLGALSIIFFAIMVGGSATIVRASIMALLVVLARATGRVSDMTRALFLAGFIMVIHNPQIVVFDPSFQLSFLATLGLIFLSPRLSEFFKFIPKKFYFRETVTATISTQIFVLPLLLYMTGEFSVIAVVVNLLVLMFIPLTMLGGFLAGILGFVSSWLAAPFSYLTYFLLSYELKVVEFFASLPFVSFKVPLLSFYLVFLIYFLYFLFLWKFPRKINKVDLLK